METKIVYQKQLIIVVHCNGGESGSAHALAQVKISVENGADGVFLILHGGRHQRLIAIYHDVRNQWPELFIGLNFLDLNAEKAYAALPEGCQALWTDDGIDGYGPDTSIKNLHAKTNGQYKCQIYAGFAFKYRTDVIFEPEASNVSSDREELLKCADCKDMVEQYLDVVTTSGPGTGKPAELENVKQIRGILKDGKKLALASGVSIANVGPCLPFVDQFVVASSVETYGMSGQIVPHKVKELVDLIHSYKTEQIVVNQKIIQISKMEVDQTVIDVNEQFKDLKSLYERPSEFATEDFEADGDLLEGVADAAQILVIGAGGLGCEILKDLAMSGIRNITVIDMDKIDLTNLNRQFLFRKKDVNDYKAKVAAEFVMKRVPGVTIKYHTQMIQDFPVEFYKDFQVIITGLDNVEARSWMNQTLHELVEFDEDGAPNPETQIRLVDGGTEGFAGQARVIIPFQTGCYECTKAGLPPQTSYPMCTIRECPRLPEHCIQYAYVIEWENEFGKDKTVDKDSPDDMKWICQKAQERGDHYGIQGVTYNLTMGVVKNIIPAIASTNALISAACVTETFKILSGSNVLVDDYMQYMGQTNVTTTTYKVEKLEECMVCSCTRTKYDFKKSQKLSEVLEVIKTKEALNRPGFLTLDGDTIYIPHPPALEEMHHYKLDLTLQELMDKGDLPKKNQFLWMVLDKNIKSKMIATVSLSD